MVEGLTAGYGGTPYLSDVTFRCRPGRVAGLIGPAGAGKTTVLRTLVGLLKTSAGTALIDGHQFTDLPQPARHVGVITDSLGLHPGRRGREEVALAAAMLGLPRTAAEQALSRVGLHAHDVRRRVRTCPRSVRLRIALARALVGDPPVLIADSPATGLDAEGHRVLTDVLTAHALRGGTVLLTGRRPAELVGFANDLIVIASGRVLAQGTTQGLIEGGSQVTATDNRALASRLRNAGLTVSVGEEALTVSAPPEQVGQIAADNGIPLVRLIGLRGDLADFLNSLDREPDQVPPPTQRAAPLSRRGNR